MKWCAVWLDVRIVNSEIFGWTMSIWYVLGMSNYSWRITSWQMVVQFVEAWQEPARRRRYVVSRKCCLQVQELLLLLLLLFLFFLPFLVDDQETIYLPCPDMLTTHGRRPRTGTEVCRLRLVQNQNSRDLAAVFAVQMIWMDGQQE